MAKTLSVAETIRNAETNNNVATNQQVIEPVMDAALFIAPKFIKAEAMEEIEAAPRGERASIYPWNELKAPIIKEDGRKIADHFFVPGSTKKKLDQNVNQRNAVNKEKGKVERYLAVRATGPNGVEGVKVYRVA